MRQAIVVIHGVGEQRPVDTIRGFVMAITDGRIFSKPDRLSESFELRRLYLEQSRSRPRTDVYELYWAHHMQRATWASALNWMGRLIFRSPWSVPRGLRWTHGFLCFFILVAVVAAAYSILRAFNAQGGGWDDFLQSWITYVPLVVFLGELLFGRLMLGYIGDAARYLTPDPENIEVRAKIRAEGIHLLRALHDSRQYSRIVVVGHSLGSVIGYDVLRHLWDEMRMPVFEKASQQPEAKKFQGAVDAVSEPLPGVTRASAVDTFQQAQHRLWHEHRSVGTPWLITDFVTLGSPLAHAELLLEARTVTLDQRKRERELPTCPPTFDDTTRIHYGENHEIDGSRLWNFLIPDHGAVFSGTRWTNLYFPHKWLIFGDVIGGPLAEIFGRGIRDVPVRPNRGGFWPKTLASHVKYWEGDALEDPKTRLRTDRKTGTKDTIGALKSALFLDAKRSKVPWPDP